MGGTSRWPIELPFCHGAEEKSPGQSPLGDWVPEEKLRVGHPTLRSRTLPHLGHKLKLETRIQGSLEMVIEAVGVGDRCQGGYEG